jgi:hypothetical protein
MRKQLFPLQFTHFHKECEVKLLESALTISPECNREIVTLDEVVWLTFRHNL